MYNQLISKKSRLAVVGLGNVGLPLALEFSRTLSVIGYDCDELRVRELNMKNDSHGVISAEEFNGCDVIFTSRKEDLAGADFFIIVVPVSIDKHNNPDLTAVKEATAAVAGCMKKGSYVVYESTMYPGCTQEVLVPMLEEVSGMKCMKDFKVGYSPERMDVSNPFVSLRNTVKVVAACDDESIEVVASVYGMIVKAGVHKAPTMRIAESAKLLENIQMDLNIALMNECSVVFNTLGVPTQDVIQAASTNRRFVACQPGLVGGNELAMDPYQMVFKANSADYHSHLIPEGRYINDSMVQYIATQTVKKLLSHDMPLLRARVLVMGITYQADTAEYDNSKVIDVVKELKSYRIAVDVVDPYVNSVELDEYCGITLSPAPSGKYHAIVLASPHKQYVDMTEEEFKAMLDPNGIVIDIYGMLRNQIRELRYWSL